MPFCISKTAPILSLLATLLKKKTRTQWMEEPQHTPKKKKVLMILVVCVRQAYDLVQGVGGRVGGMRNIYPNMYVPAAFRYYRDTPTLIQITETKFSNTHLSDGLKVNYVLCSQS